MGEAAGEGRVGLIVPSGTGTNWSAVLIKLGEAAAWGVITGLTTHGTGAPLEASVTAGVAGAVGKIMHSQQLVSPSAPR